VVIQGSNERERGEVEIKDLIEGAKAAGAIASNEEWKAARPAQFSVSEAKLVEAVREVLAHLHVRLLRLKHEEVRELDFQR
jgi:histidyl-tRNA synthetase